MKDGLRQPSFFKKANKWGKVGEEVVVEKREARKLSVESTLKGFFSEWRKAKAVPDVNQDP